MTLTPANDRFRSLLASELPEDILRPPEQRYLEEPRGNWQGQAGLLAIPRSTEDVATLIRLANKHRVAVVPYGGGTGLVCGQILETGPLPMLISLERMNRQRAVFPQENVLIVEAGMILADVQAAAAKVDRLFPLSLAAEGTAQIGGNLSTNAGGTGVLRYGNARDLCLGLEAVLPDGSIWNGLSRLRKDNTGYDLRNLLIGAEGTLGIITAASLKLMPKPAATGTAIFVIRDPQAALELLSIARNLVGEGISAFELIHGQGLEFLSEELPDIRQPFADISDWCMLVEFGLAQGQSPNDALETLFAQALEAGLASDGLIAQSQAQAQDFWSVREHIPEANRRIGSVSSHDISVPLGALPEFIETATEQLSNLAEFRINCFGHVGDGNLHFNIFPAKGKSRADYSHLRTDVKQSVHDLLQDIGGSISAEHGVGRYKAEDLERYGDPVKLRTMRSIKSALDPNGIMNPGAVLR